MAHKEIQSNYDINTVLTLKVANAIIASSTTTTGTPYIPMTNSQGIAFVITAADANLAGAVTVKVLEATATGTGLKT
ncbi:MAG: hypothetical protein GWO10_31045, partial [candidate division Zixibacteria bacterium]|nr:hypothetical protein [Phycisphaerae bacterium]NIR27696.1 hypothetical protein [Gammaproteobacteria bacterium]NIR68099.1 hypothetical protein [candidate division Zixibacteria bacterium]NIW98070.1 hypothetical protein [Phycisphaerae bacterium]